MPEKRISPMLAKETGTPFNNADWLFEVKWDGYRAIAVKRSNEIALYSRNGNNFNEKYPLVVKALAGIAGDFILDGEIVVLNEDGKPSFQFLQHYSENQSRPIQFQIFDILKYGDEDLTGLPLLERKEKLKLIIPEDDILKYSEHVMKDGKDFFDVAKEADLEGIMGKKADSAYYPGKRTSDWLKIKNHKSIEAIIVGYTDPAGSRKFFGSLVLADKKGKKLNYIGHTGTGFTDKMLKEIYQMMQPLRVEKSPFDEKIKMKGKVYWLKPKLLCEIKFTEFTKEGILRHPAFLRLRDDKSASQINAE